MTTSSRRLVGLIDRFQRAFSGCLALRFLVAQHSRLKPGGF